MKKSILTALLFSVFAVAHAKPYPKHDLSKVVTPTHIDFAIAEQTYRDLSQHASAYPTKFDNAADKARATAEAKELARIYNGLFATQIITPDNEHYHQILHRAARVNWMAHNLDVPNSATWADSHYQTLLAQASGQDKARWMGEYGYFLASVGQTNKAVNVLQQAVAQGNTAAKHDLALALLMQNKKDQAVQTLREYIQAYPKDTTAKEMLEAIQAGRVQVQSVK